MEFSDYVVYVDESGDQNLIHTDPSYPIFSLAFCIFKKSEYTKCVVPGLQDLKFRWFGHDAFVLHERELRKRERPFEMLTPRERHEAFMADLTGLIAAAPMMLIAAVIHKEEHKAKYAAPANPYELAVRFCVERLAYFLREEEQDHLLTHIIVERRGVQEDRDLELEFHRICAGNKVLKRAGSLDILFVDKKANSTGLQIADLFARPLGLKVLRPDQPNRAYDVIEKKFRRDKEGNAAGYGFKIFP